MISENLRSIKQEIKNSCALFSRSEKDVTLIAVTKTVTVEKMVQLVDEGVRHFAENRVDVFLDKKDKLSIQEPIVWHFIGNLQRRKVKSVINELDYFHALDSLKLAQEIQKRATKKIKCFVEVNISGEESKHGVSPNRLKELLIGLANLSSIEVVGLMTMAPYDSTKVEQHKIFSELHHLQHIVQQYDLPSAPCLELSMGMSNDYQVAISEGATFIRVGTALFTET